MPRAGHEPAQKLSLGFVKNAANAIKVYDDCRVPMLFKLMTSAE